MKSKKEIVIIGSPDLHYNTFSERGILDVKSTEKPSKTSYKEQVEKNPYPTTAVKNPFKHKSKFHK